ncbi:unnamed protein product, partial [Brachionus calyciflorus]
MTTNEIYQGQQKPITIHHHQFPIIVPYQESNSSHCTPPKCLISCLLYFGLAFEL